MEFFVSITFATELVHKKQKLKRQLIVAFEKQTLKWQWKEDKIICGKANSYFRRLSGPFRKNEEISKVVYFFSFGLKLKMKLVETVSVSIGVKFRQTSYVSKRNLRHSKEFAFLLLIGIVSSFVLWKKCFAFHFLLSLKKRFWLYCCKSVEWKQKQQWDKFRVGKKLEGKAKSFNMAD